ncbi:MAG TPA: hypothetical protein VE954_16465 [Oligoflexus sp.]|uniref:hypothetical protein n=1 Tax=Oligoflexus sp. TaxID=1971216 RepID=UPI002D59D252|nr:hypothetical protein [Oligoflexus sp.]HYX34693.1 hypothetical protein [Oligoflexus sp.]
MGGIISVIIVMSMLVQPKVHAQSRIYQANPNETLAYLALAAAAYGLAYLTISSVAHVIRNGDDYSDSRKSRYGLVEGGITGSYGSSYAAGVFLSDNSLLLGRYTWHLSPNSDIDFKTYEIGYRHYYEVLFGEIGLFKARHRQFEGQYPRMGDSGRAYMDSYYFDAHETDGAFMSFGLSLQFWRVSTALRATYHYGLSTRTVETYGNDFDVSNRLKVDARDEFHRQRRVYLELGLVL